MLHSQLAADTAACLLLAAAACLRPMLASSQRSQPWLAGWLADGGWLVARGCDASNGCIMAAPRWRLLAGCCCC
jgi:hypothetical protein